MPSPSIPTSFLISPRTSTPPMSRPLIQELHHPMSPHRLSTLSPHTTVVSIPPSFHSLPLVISHPPLRPRRMLPAPPSTTLHPSTNPLQAQFRVKVVCRLACRHCHRIVCHRGMKAILLADTRVELYSTDAPPKRSVQLIQDDYVTSTCLCRIRDVACLGCGNPVGYLVTYPCTSCLDACNNGHFWMFHSDATISSERKDRVTQCQVLWGQLAHPDHDQEEVISMPSGRNPEHWVACR
ncbi:Protein fam72a [Coelomomyces lativittatus]|nr:Protein fam72a [Coelomomyces lativittatus]KAJ1507918.1 Protein fam72a [Coelomomyces lativittatus]KAJ1513046.1 Protein fam72a [Coelomomyces lativittatus]